MCASFIIKGDRDGKPARKKYSVLTATITITIPTYFDFLHHGLFPTWRNDVINDDRRSRPLERVFISLEFESKGKTPYDERGWMSTSSFTNEKKSYGESIMGIDVRQQSCRTNDSVLIMRD